MHLAEKILLPQPLTFVGDYLINRTDLARLTIRHGVGARDRQAYFIRRIDEDYFAEEEE